MVRVIPKEISDSITDYCMMCELTDPVTIAELGVFGQ